MNTEVLEKDFEKVDIDNNAMVKAGVSNSPYYGENFYMEKERFQMLSEKIKVIEGLIVLLESNVNSLNTEGRDQLKVRLESIVQNF